MKDELLRLLEHKPNMTNFGRSLAATNPDLHAWVVSTTPFLPDGCQFNERVFCIVQGLPSRPTCPVTGKMLRFVNYFSGYRKVSGSPARGTLGEAGQGITLDDREFLTANADALASSPRKFMLDHPDMIQRMIAETRSFGDVSITERLYCIVNGITVRPEQPFKSFFVGYGKTARRDVVDAELLKFAQMVGSDDPRHGSKVKKFIMRNRERNAALYELPASEQGESFVVCPVLGIRTLNIKRPYVEGVLLTPWDEFRRRYPDAPLACSGHSRRISQGLAEEAEPGVSRHAMSVAKSTVTRAKVGEDGLTVNQRKGIKTRATHMSKVDEHGLNGYQRIADGRNRTVLPNGLSVQANALVKRWETCTKNASFGRKSSKLAARALLPIIQLLDDLGEKYYFDKNEYGVQRGKERYFYDLVIPSISLCVEFQSKRYHPNPYLDKTTWDCWRAPFTHMTADEKADYDRRKARLLSAERGFATWFVWEDTTESDVLYLKDYVKECFERIIGLKS